MARHGAGHRRRSADADVKAPLRQSVGQARRKLKRIFLKTGRWIIEKRIQRADRKAKPLVDRQSQPGTPVTAQVKSPRDASAAQDHSRKVPIDKSGSRSAISNL